MWGRDGSGKGWGGMVFSNCDLGLSQTSAILRRNNFCRSPQTCTQTAFYSDASSCVRFYNKNKIKLCAQFKQSNIGVNDKKDKKDVYVVFLLILSLLTWKQSFIMLRNNSRGSIFVQILLISSSTQ